MPAKKSGSPSKPSAHDPTQVKRAASQQGPVHFYLVAYNVASGLAWGAVLLRLLYHMGSDESLWMPKFLSGGALDKVLQRGTTAYADFGQLTKWVQTGALLEIAHSALGLVRSGLGTTFSQVFSRIAMVWYVANEYSSVPETPFYVSMVLAWSVTEVVRYSFYAAGLLGIPAPGLEWFRYNTFFLLYPVGAGSEIALFYRSLPYATKRFGAAGKYGTIVALIVWPLALAVMMLHMNAQRRKFIKKTRASKTTASKTAAIDDAPPARSTRSKSKAL